MPDAPSPQEDARSTIFRRIRAALEPLPERTPAPVWAAADIATRQQGIPGTLWEKFVLHLVGVNGTPLLGLPALGTWLRQEQITLASVDPALIPLLRPHLEGVVLEGEFRRERVDDYGCGITRAQGAIAETGSVILADATTSSRLAALAPWVHVALLRPADLHATVLDAISALGSDRNVIWATGPSKTADVEGILIEGVHGPGRQVVVLTEELPAP